MQTEPSIYDVHARLSHLEKDHIVIRQTVTSVQNEVSKYVSDFKTEIAVMQRDISYIKASQDKVVSGLNRLLWAIGLAFVGAVVAFIVNGGLAGPL